jgi:uncharacterized protein YidB (DUF937 family)
MGLLDGIMGGLVSAGATAMISQVLEKNGGIQGLIAQFEEKGLGGMVQSWVGTGENQAIEPAQLQHAMGSGTLEAIAAKTGMSVEELTAQLSKLLPEAVDKMTPNGHVAEAA